MRVDVHTHFLPLECVREMQRLDAEHAPSLQTDPDTGRGIGSVGGRTFGPFGRGLYDAEPRLGGRGERAVDVQVLSVVPFLLGYGLEASLAGTFARIMNDGMARVVAAYPERCLGLATVPLQDPPAAALELERAMGELGLRGAEIGTHVAGRNLDDPALEPFWAAAERLGAFLLLHPTDVAGADRLGRYYLANLVGNPLETTIAVASLIFGGVLERHPGLTLCCVHGGGFVPYQIGRLDLGWHIRPECRASISDLPGSYVRRLYFDSILHDPQALRYLAQMVGPERVLLASDYPFDMRPEEAVQSVLAVEDLGEDERAAILGGTAARLLGLSGAPPAAPRGAGGPAPVPPLG